MKTIKKFTDTLVKNLQTTGKRYDVTEGNGFCLRVSAKGKKSWVYSYWFDGKSRRFTVGCYPATKVAQARKLVVDAGLLKDNGIDPIQAKEDAETKPSITIKWLANEFYTDYIEKTRKSPLNVKQIIDAEIIPNLGSIELNKLTTRQIVLSVKEIANRGANSHANKTLATIKQLLNYAISIGLTEVNPAQNIKAKVIGGIEKPRDRYLTLEEIKIIWLWLSNKANHHMHSATVLALKVLLLTGCRSGELRLAEWSEIDFDNSLWIIPKEKYKTGIEHKIYLSEFTIQHLLEMQELSGCKYVLPSTKDTDNPKPLTDKTLPRAVKRIQSRMVDDDGELLIAEPWTPHDIRRSFRTQLSKLGIFPFIAEKCLGHKLSKIEGTYDINEYLPERQEALELWSDKVEALVTNSNVVAISNG